MNQEKTNDFLDMLRKIYEQVIKLDKMVDKTLGKGFFGFKPKDQMKRIANFPRTKVEELFYANIVKAIMDNIDDSENMKEAGYTKNNIKMLRQDWGEILSKPKEIIGNKTTDEVSRFTRQEYHNFRDGVCRISKGLKNFINHIEEYVQLEACEKYIDDTVG